MTAQLGIRETERSCEPGDHGPWSIAAVLVTAGLIDGAIILVFVRNEALPAALATHVLLVLALALGLHSARLQPNKDLNHLAVVAILFAGPAGAFLTACLTAWLLADGAASSESTYVVGAAPTASQGDDVEQLVHQLHTSRTMALDAPLLARFDDLMRTAPLSDRLAVLGLIAQNYHTDHYPVIARALRSDSAAVRAQAAALATSLATRYKDRLQAALTSPCADDEQLTRCIGEIVECVRSGFLEPGQAADARSVAISLCRAARGERGRQATETLVELLLEKGQLDDAYAELRTIDRIPARLRSRCLVAFVNGGHADKAGELLGREAKEVPAC